MRNLRWIPLLIMATVLAMNISCKKYDLYDWEKTQQINDSIMPIVGAIFGGFDFSNYFLPTGSG